MKFKNIFVSATCYFILTVFVTCIVCDVLFHSELRHQKSQQFANKKASALNATFLSEEEDDTNNHSELIGLHTVFSLHKSFTPFNLKDVAGYFKEINFSEFKLKIPLFIHIRVLRV